jgi:hypothetical protein|tara:strand:+ start:429 stop:530 length:102 start_codon:yes stop_codon:yes gene_type:complete
MLDDRTDTIVVVTNLKAGCCHYHISVTVHSHVL